MFTLMGPFPNYSVTTLLPSPSFGNNAMLRNSMTIMRTLDGTLFTYVKRKDSLRKLKWSFKISVNKAKELSDFINTYYASKIKATDHNGDSFIGFLKNNPVEFVGASRAFNWPGSEVVDVTLELEETG